MALTTLGRQECLKRGPDPMRTWGWARARAHLHLGAPQHRPAPRGVGGDGLAFSHTLPHTPNYTHTLLPFTTTCTYTHILSQTHGTC